MKYRVTGFINRRNKVLTKEFRTLDKANKYLDSILCSYNIQVSDSATNENITKYVCDDYTRFYVEQTNI